MPEISKAKVVILATHGFEQSELMVPQRKLKEAGAQVVVVSPERGQIRGRQRLPRRRRLRRRQRGAQHQADGDGDSEQKRTYQPRHAENPGQLRLHVAQYSRPYN